MVVLEVVDVRDASGSSKMAMCLERFISSLLGEPARFNLESVGSGSVVKTSLLQAYSTTTRASLFGWNRDER